MWIKNILYIVAIFVAIGCGGGGESSSSDDTKASSSTSSSIISSITSLSSSSNSLSSLSSLASSSSSTAARSKLVRVLGISPILNAKVTAGGVDADHELDEAEGKYEFLGNPNGILIASNGISDVADPIGIITAADPFAPMYSAPNGYTNINPFTTLLMMGSSPDTIRIEYASLLESYEYFDIDIIKEASTNPALLTDTLIAAIRISALQNITVQPISSEPIISSSAQSSVSGSILPSAYLKNSYSVEEEITKVRACHNNKTCLFKQASQSLGLINGYFSLDKNLFSDTTSSPENSSLASKQCLDSEEWDPILGICEDKNNFILVPVAQSSSSQSTIRNYKGYIEEECIGIGGAWYPVQGVCFIYDVQSTETKIKLGEFTCGQSLLWVIGEKNCGVPSGSTNYAYLNDERTSVDIASYTQTTIHGNLTSINDVDVFDLILDTDGDVIITVNAMFPMEIDIDFPIIEKDNDWSGGFTAEQILAHYTSKEISLHSISNTSFAYFSEKNSISIRANDSAHFGNYTISIYMQPESY